MNEEPRKPVKLEFIPAEYTDVFFVVHGGGRITRALARVITPPAKIVIWLVAKVHRAISRRRTAV